LKGIDSKFWSYAFFLNQLSIKILKMKIRLVFLLFLIINQTISYAQIIKGTVFDKITNESLEGASVYLDGTTIGVITNSEGKFEIDLNNTNNTQLIVSYIGFKTEIFQPSELKRNLNVFLIESPNELEEIILDADIWSRQKKMQIFESEFLGKTLASNYCRIINKEDIVLKYNSSNNTLTAYSYKPIVIINKYLGFKIVFNIQDYELQFFDNSQENPHVSKFHYAGTSFFTELKKTTSKRHLKNRQNAYNGSLIHFMRALSNKTLTENKFTVYYKSLPVEPYKFFKIAKENNKTKIDMLVDYLIIVFNNFHQSSIEFSTKEHIFYIDKNGNHNISSSILFGGSFGSKRISEMLPLNYSTNNLDD